MTRTWLRATFDDFGFHLALGVLPGAAMLSGVAVAVAGIHPGVLFLWAVTLGSMHAVLRLRRRPVRYVAYNITRDDNGLPVVLLVDHDQVPRGPAS